MPPSKESPAYFLKTGPYGSAYFPLEESPGLYILPRAQTAGQEAAATQSSHLAAILTLRGTKAGQD